MVFDPSGEKVAFIREVAGTTTTVSSNDDETPDPDSTEEAPVTVTSGPSTELFIAPVNDLGAARQVTTLGGRVSHPTWAPNGIQLAFTHETGEDAEIWVITEDGNNLRQITENESNDRDPDWSPDGNNIVFVSDQNSPGLTKVFTMSPDGTEVTQLDQRAGSSYSPRWSRDGEYIVFVNDEGGDGDLYIMEADGENVFLLTPDDGGAEDRSPVFSPDDNWIGFVSNRDGATFQTYLVDRRGNTPIRVTNTDRDDQAVDFRPELLLRLRQN
jgi:Tol biopolymer transport system component